MKPEISFEFFPPQTAEGAEKLRATRRQLAQLKPAFFSCTFGAGGSTRDRTLETVLEIQAEDRIGLLYDVFTTIGELNIEIVHARISTQQGAAIDSFYLVDEATGEKIKSAQRLKQLGAEIRKTLNLED